MASIWESLNALRSAVGEDWREPVLLADEADLVEDIQMHHCETFGV